MLKIKWTDRITDDEVFQRAKEERLLLKIFKNRRHLWIGHTIKHNEFVVNILEGAISGKKGSGKTSTTILKASRQKQRSWQLYSNEKNALQQFQMESCQPIKTLRDKKISSILNMKEATSLLMFVTLPPLPNFMASGKSVIVLHSVTWTLCLMFYQVLGCVIIMRHIIFINYVARQERESEVCSFETFAVFRM